MRRSEAFKSRYLGRDDLAAPTRATIDTVRMESIQSDDALEDKAVMFFREPNIKPMIVNSTNWQVCEDAFGGDSDDWAGNVIEVYVDPGVMFKGKRTGGVRVRIVNGVPAVSTLSYAEALALCAGVGLNKDVLIAELKAHGAAGYNPVRDTPIVRALVASNPNPPNGEPPVVDDIPFDFSSQVL